MSEKVQVKKWQIGLLILIVLVSLGGRLYTYYWPKAELTIGGQRIKVLVADNEMHQYKGLGGRGDLGKYGGMLFTFPTKIQHAIVMREMKFSIDIVWLANGEIIDMAPNVQAEPGRTEDQLTVYLARLPSNGVLELPAGFLLKNGVKIGDKVQIHE